MYIALLHSGRKKVIVLTVSCKIQIQTKTNLQAECKFTIMVVTDLNLWIKKYSMTRITTIQVYALICNNSRHFCSVCVLVSCFNDRELQKAILTCNVFDPTYWRSQKS